MTNAYYQQHEMVRHEKLSRHALRMREISCTRARILDRTNLARVLPEFARFAGTGRKQASSCSSSVYGRVLYRSRSKSVSSSLRPYLLWYERTQGRWQSGSVDPGILCRRLVAVDPGAMAVASRLPPLFVGHR